jgi:hypothetical protein
MNQEKKSKAYQQGEKLREALSQLYAGGWIRGVGDGQDTDISVTTIIQASYLRANATRNKKAIAQQVSNLLSFSCRGLSLVGEIEVENDLTQREKGVGYTGKTYYVRLRTRGKRNWDFGRVFAVRTRSNLTQMTWL